MAALEAATQRASLRANDSFHAPTRANGVGGSSPPMVNDQNRYSRCGVSTRIIFRVAASGTHSDNTRIRFGLSI